MLKLVSLGGIVAMLALCFALSRDRAAIKWRLVGVGLLIQAALGFTFLYWEAGNEALRSAGAGVESFLQLSQEGSTFVFGALAQKPDIRSRVSCLTRVLPWSARVTVDGSTLAARAISLMVTRRDGQRGSLIAQAAQSDGKRSLPEKSRALRMEREHE